MCIRRAQDDDDDDDWGVKGAPQQPQAGPPTGQEKGKADPGIKASASAGRDEDDDEDDEEDEEDGEVYVIQPRPKGERSFPVVSRNVSVPTRTASWPALRA
jgi:hypothetical protein